MKNKIQLGIVALLTSIVVNACEEPQRMEGANAKTYSARYTNCINSIKNIGMYNTPSFFFDENKGVCVCNDVPCTGNAVCNESNACENREECTKDTCIDKTYKSCVKENPSEDKGFFSDEIKCEYGCDTAEPKCRECNDGDSRCINKDKKGYMQICKNGFWTNEEQCIDGLDCKDNKTCKECETSKCENGYIKKCVAGKLMDEEQCSFKAECAINGIECQECGGDVSRCVTTSSYQICADGKWSEIDCPLDASSCIPDNNNLKSSCSGKCGIERTVCLTKNNKSYTVECKDGYWINEQECPNNGICDEAGTKCIDCINNMRKCIEGKIVKCVNNEWQEEEMGTENEEICPNGCRLINEDPGFECRKCIPNTCKNGDMCNEDGSDTTECKSKQCDNNDKCFEQNLNNDSCEKENMCNEDGLICSSEKNGKLKWTKCNVEGEMCIDGKCTSTPSESNDCSNNDENKIVIKWLVEIQECGVCIGKKYGTVTDLKTSESCNLNFTPSGTFQASRSVSFTSTETITTGCYDNYFFVKPAEPTSSGTYTIEYCEKGCKKGICGKNAPTTEKECDGENNFKCNNNILMCKSKSGEDLTVGKDTQIAQWLKPENNGCLKSETNSFYYCANNNSGNLQETCKCSQLNDYYCFGNKGYKCASNGLIEDNTCNSYCESKESVIGVVDINKCFSSCSPGHYLCVSGNPQICDSSSQWSSSFGTDSVRLISFSIDAGKIEFTEHCSLSSDHYAANLDGSILETSTGFSQFISAEYTDVIWGPIKVQLKSTSDYNNGCGFFYNVDVPEYSSHAIRYVITNNGSDSFIEFHHCPGDPGNCDSGFQECE